MYIHSVSGSGYLALLLLLFDVPLMQPPLFTTQDHMTVVMASSFWIYWLSGVLALEVQLGKEPVAEELLVHLGNLRN